MIASTAACRLLHSVCIRSADVSCLLIAAGVFGLLALIGGSACVTFSYIFPALLLWRCQKGVLYRFGALGMMSLGMAMAALAVYDQLMGIGGVELHGIAAISP